MKLEKSDIDIFLMLWIKKDQDLWGELRQIQIRLLLDRIIKEMSFKEMAQLHGTTESKIRQIFEAILAKIGRCISSEIAKHLRIINDKLEERPEKPFEVVTVHLN